MRRATEVKEGQLVRVGDFTYTVIDAEYDNEITLRSDDERLCPGWGPLGTYQISALSIAGLRPWLTPKEA